MRMKKSRLLTLMVLFMGLSALFVENTSAQQITANLLQDPSFEGETYVFISRDPLDENVTYSVPQFWGGGVALSPRDQPWQNVHPTGFPHFGAYKRTGNRSFHMARGGGTFTAYLFQQTWTQPGSTVMAGAFAFIEGTTGLARVGIDPTGGGNPFSPAVVWSGWASGAYQWNQLSVSATAGSSGSVTIFLYATQQFPSDPNGVYWDDASLIGVPVARPAAGAPTSGEGGGGQFVAATVRLNVRSGPGTTFERIGRINPGDPYRVVESLDGWYGIEYNGRTGYVAAQYVQPASAPSASAGPISTASSLDFTLLYTVRLRSGPGTTFDTLTRVPFNTIVRAVGRNASNTWLQVVYEGQTGWVAAQYGQLDGSINSLPVR
jgi:uncharacterized protein YraI